MAGEQRLSDDELAEAVDRIPLDLVAESPPAIREWVERGRAQRQLKEIGYDVSRWKAIQISRQIVKEFERGRIVEAPPEASQAPTKWSGEPTDPAGIRALSEVLMAWKQRQERNGTEQDRHESSWPNVMDARLDQIKGSSLEDKYAHVADMAAACLSWLACLAWLEAPDKGEATPQSEDE